MNQTPQGAIGAALQNQQLTPASLPAPMQAELAKLTQIYGPEVAAMLMQQQQQQAGRANVTNAVQSLQQLGASEDPRAQFAQMASMAQM